MRFYAGYDPMATPMWMSELLYRCMPVLKAREAITVSTAAVLPWAKDYFRKEHFRGLGHEARFVLMPPPAAVEPPAERDPEKAREWFLANGIMVN